MDSRFDNGGLAARRPAAGRVDRHGAVIAAEQRDSWRGGLRLTLLCLALAIASIAVTLIPG